MSAVIVFYTAGYFLWAIYYRHRESVFGRFIERKSWLGYFLKDLGHAAALYWILVNVRASNYPLTSSLSAVWWGSESLVMDPTEGSDQVHVHARYRLRAAL